MICILGATSYVAQGLIDCYDSNELVLLSRSYNNLDRLGDYKCDIVINCINPWDKNNIINFFSVSEYYDNYIIEYISKYPDTLYVNFSSGDVYFLESKKVSSSNPYAIGKLYIETKHRYLPFNIVDIRLFSYFSKFIPINSHYLMSNIVNALKNKNILITDSCNIVRDYVIPEDLCELINCCRRKKINDSFDIYSKAPISKFDLLEHLSIKFGLEWVIGGDDHLPGTVFKERYYSNNYKAHHIGYSPKYSSLSGIDKELNDLRVNLPKYRN